MTLRKGQTERMPPRRRHLDRVIQVSMVWLSYFFLAVLAMAGLPAVVVLIADALPRLAGSAPSLSGMELELLFGLLAVVWPVFIAEAVFRIFWLEFGRTTLHRRAAIVLAALFPPLRLGLTPGSAPNCLWLPVLGWCTRDRLLCKDLAKRFSFPMVLFAFAVIPLIAIELVMTIRGEVPSSVTLLVFVAGTQIVWLAFAVEFFTRLAAHERNLDYCKSHWVDALIVVLPVVSFLRIARLASMGRIYRLRGLAQRGYQALLVLRVFERWSMWGARSRIRSLRNKIERLEEQIEDSHEEIAELEALIETTNALRRQRNVARVRKRRAKRDAEAARAADAAARQGEPTPADPRTSGEPRSVEADSAA